MDLGACWQGGAWADGSWVADAWCPESAACTPASIGECWAVAWCSGTWQTNVWCPPTAAPAAGNIFYGDNFQLKPWVMPDDRNARRRKREDEEILIL